MSRRWRAFRAPPYRVVNGDSNVKAPTREKVERAVAQLGYTPTRRPARSPPATAIPSGWSPRRTAAASSGADGLRADRGRVPRQTAAGDRGRNSAENEWQAIQRLFSLRCDGVILRAFFSATIGCANWRRNNVISCCSIVWCAGAGSPLCHLRSPARQPYGDAATARCRAPAHRHQRPA